MRVLTKFLAVMSLLVFIPCIASDALSGEIKQGDKVTIITPGTTARLCPHPMCAPGQHITRMPEGTVLKVEGIQDAKIGTFAVRWFEVTYEGSRGWISIFDTDKAEK
jgi:hypothetical protein